jgi:glycosyltransferase involved in cell wall biosynthesis
MLITIVTPVLNGAKTIERTLRSVSAQRGDYEHIVMDGGSTDGTAEIVERYQSVYPVRLVRQPDRSLYEGVWNGMQLARGEILCYLNADDLHLPWTLATVASVFANRPEVHWLTGIPSWQRDDTGVTTTCGYAPVFLQSLIRRGWYSSARLGFMQQESMFWRRSLWERAAPQDILLKYRLGGDFHLWRRFADHAALHTVAATLACFVISSQQASRTGLAKYLAECGVRGSSATAPAAGRAFHRLLSQLLFRRVIVPSVHVA